MGFYLKLLIQPFISIYSLISLIWLPKIREIDLDLDSCENYNKTYFYIIRDESLDDQKKFAEFGKNYLQKAWGMVKYPNNNPKKPSTHKEVLYSSLGAVKNRDLGLDTDLFELSCYGILDNGNAILDHSTEYPTEVINFRPNIETTSDKALAIISMLEVLRRSGDLWIREEMYPQCKSVYRLFIYMPDFRNLDDILTSYYILIKYGQGFSRIWLKSVVFFLGILYHRKMDKFCKHIARECIAA